MSVHFIADLHLSEDQAETVHAFCAYLAGPARSAKTLYILGDLFEYWAGDDDDSRLADEVASALSALADSGIAINFIAGNRDFLLGSAFASRCAMRLLPDPSLIEIDGRQLLLTHGDLLCTDDTAYLQYRKQVRDPVWQQAFLNRPLTQRKAFIAELRARSREETAHKSAEIMDVNPDAVSALLRRYDYPVLIHGHTHRPAVHRIDVDGRRCERWVLADWHATAEYLVWEADAGQARRYPAASR